MPERRVLKVIKGTCSWCLVLPFAAPWAAARDELSAILGLPPSSIDLVRAVTDHSGVQQQARIDAAHCYLVVRRGDGGWEAPTEAPAHVPPPQAALPPPLRTFVTSLVPQRVQL